MANETETTDIDPYLSKSVSSLDDPRSESHQNGHTGGQEDLVQYAVNKVRENPLLAVGAVAAVGAIAVLALTHRRSNNRSLERRVSRQLAAAERSLKNAVNRTGASTGLSDFTDRIASQLSRLDVPQFAQLQQRAVDAIQHAANRVSSAMR